MPPKKTKITVDKAGPSAVVAAMVTTDAAARNNAAITTEPSTPQPQMDNTASPGGREQTPEEGDVQEVEIDQNDDEIEEDKDDEITEQARNLKTLSQYQQDILRL
jgi:hypothetical protein